jgi:microcin C transport system substrate-binding protein
MKKYWLISALAVAACGSGDPESGEAAGAQSPDDGDVIFGQTRLVADPPTYESKPLPDGLEWITNDEDPIFASPDAIRGGTLTDYMTSFPQTLRLYGPNSSSGDFTSIRRSTSLSLLDLHPNTLNFIPSLATHWAYGDDGRTVFYRLNPDARWSDGVPVMADDYLFQRDFRRSEHIVDPYGANFYTEEITDVSKYDDYTISVTAGSVQPPYELIYSTVIGPSPRHYHVLDENWIEDYNWRVQPVTGPYQISAVEKGRYIELTRLNDWWANDLKYYQHRFNPDKVRVDIIRDENVAFEYFLRGELDRYDLSRELPSRWHDQAQGSDFDNGYIGRIQHYVDVPQRASGLWINQSDPVLGDRNVRYGLAHSLDFDRVLRTVFRGDYERLQHPFEGYLWGYSHPDIRAREFDLELADQYFDAAGWTDRASDGIRMKDGRRLSVRISYATDDHTPWLVVLREEARKAGIELALQLLDPSTWSNQLTEKSFQIIYVAFSGYIVPSPWQSWHSENANVTDTNNITNTANPELDEVIDAFDVATTLEERVRLSHRFQELIYAEAAMIPTFKIPYVREVFWRWLKLPDDYGTRTESGVMHSDGVFNPFATGLMWIDEDERAATLAARRAGETFEPIEIVSSAWRVQ